MRDLARVTKIQNIEVIKGKDRIELATVDNYPVIVQKGAYHVDDLVVYIGYDTLLPEKPEFEFLRSRCWSNTYKGFRIRNMSMAGVYSSGIVFPLSILPTNVKIVDGLDVTEILGIRKYDTEALEEEKIIAENKKSHGAFWFFLMRFPIFRILFTKKKNVVKFPSTVKKSDETNVEKAFSYWKNLRTYWYVTEKMEGQSATYMLLGKRRKYLVFSRNTLRNPKGNGTWETVGKMYEIEKKLRSCNENYAIQGEICGNGIQGNIYGFDTLRFFVYKVTNTETGKSLNFYDLVHFCSDVGLEMVPIIDEAVTLPDDLNKIVHDADGDSVFKNNGKIVPREGLVYRSMNDQEMSFKAKGRKYQVWFHGNKETV